MKLKLNMQKILAPAALVILYVFFAIFGKNFFDTYTLKTILESSYYVGFMAFGVTFVIISGGIDLSLGSNMMCSALLGCYAYHAWGVPLWLGLVICIAVGTFFGFANCVMIAKFKLPPFIATLGTQMVTLGLGAIMAKIRKVKILPALDLSGLGYLIGQGVGRLGNFVNGEAFGSNTDLPWGMSIRELDTSRMQLVSSRCSRAVSYME